MYITKTTMKVYRVTSTNSYLIKTSLHLYKRLKDTYESMYLHSSMVVSY